MAALDAYQAVGRSVLRRVGERKGDMAQRALIAADPLSQGGLNTGDGRPDQNLDRRAADVRERGNEEASPIPSALLPGIAARSARPPRRIAFRWGDGPNQVSATGRVVIGTEPPPSIDALPKREDVLGTQVDSLGTNRAITIAYAGKKPANYRFYFALAERNSDEGKCKPCP